LKESNSILLTEIYDIYFPDVVKALE
jgi:hypothetical protein